MKCGLKTITCLSQSFKVICGWTFQVVSKVNMGRILEVKHLKLLRWWRYLQTMNHESSSPNLRVSKTCILCWFNSSIKATEDVLYNIRSTQNSKELSDACCCLMHFSQIVLSHKLGQRITCQPKQIGHTWYSPWSNCQIFCCCLQLMFNVKGLRICVDCWLLASEQSSKLKWS